MKSRDDQYVLRLVVATGIASVVTQLLLIREYLSQFQGNEFVIALILFGWLSLGAAGTYTAGRIATGSGWISPSRGKLGWLSLLLAALPVVVIFSVRLLRDTVFLHGRSVGFYDTAVFVFSTLCAYALLVGFLLPFSLYVLRARAESDPTRRVYIADGIGDMAGGALFSFVLVFLVSPMQAVAVTGTILAVLAVVVAVSDSDHPPRRIVAGAIVCASVLAAGMVLERWTLSPTDGSSLVEYRETRYGRITVFRDHGQVTVFQDGAPTFTSGDIVTAEEAIHYPMSQLEKPEHVLLISAGSGMLRELEKYGLQSVDYVELNPDVAEIQFRYGLLHRIPGLRILYRDGRAYLSQTSKRYDAVIVCLPEPDTFQVNRFFSDGFFRMVRKRLTRTGILAFSVEGFENYLGEAQRQKVSSLANTAGLHFSYRLLLPGQRIHFLFALQPLNPDIPGLLAARGIPTRYIGAYFQGNVTRERIAQLDALVDASAPLNTDLSPHLMRIMLGQWFAKHAASPTLFLWAVGVVTAVYLIRIHRPQWVLFTTGFVTMGSEILVIFAFQIFFGYVYLQIGLIVTVFLAGLIPGALLTACCGFAPRRALLISDGLLALLAGCFAWMLHTSSAAPPALAFWGFGFMVSLLCGFQFPMAVSLAGGEKAAGAAFSADLMGAALGILITSTVLIPNVGVVWAAAVLGVLKIVSLVSNGIYGTNQQT